MRYDMTVPSATFLAPYGIMFPVVAYRVLKFIRIHIMQIHETLWKFDNTFYEAHCEISQGYFISLQETGEPIEEQYWRDLGLFRN